MTTILLIITVTALTSFLAWRSPSLLDSWLMNPYRIYSRGEYHRFLTSGFIHADIGHLLFNMLSLYFFGGIIEQIFSALFGGLYLAYSYYESKQNRGNVNHDAHLYGAIFGIVAMIAIYPQVLPQFIEQIASWRIF